MRFVISLGGSVVVPEEIDSYFLKGFRQLIRQQAKKGNSFIIVVGGGKTCRKYQEAAKSIGRFRSESLDYIGISASRLNAELILRIFGDEAYDKIIVDPLKKVSTRKRIIVGAGFLPGCSTDLRAVQLARTYDINRVINISNIDHVYNKDPSRYKDAGKIENISWTDFQKIVGNRWSPGSNLPFDPIASRFAKKQGIEVIILGKDLLNLSDIFKGNSFKGTTIGP